MNTAVAVFVVATLAVANAGYLGAPALSYAAAPVGVAYSSGIVRGAPLVTAAHHEGLVRIGRGIGYAAHGAPLAVASPVAVSYSSGIVRGAPLIAGAHHGPFVLDVESAMVLTKVWLLLPLPTPPLHWVLLPHWLTAFLMVWPLQLLMELHSSVRGSSMNHSVSINNTSAAISIWQLICDK